MVVPGRWAVSCERGTPVCTFSFEECLCRASMTNIRQSIPDSLLGCHAKIITVMKMFQLHSEPANNAITLNKQTGKYETKKMYTKETTRIKRKKKYRKKHLSNGRQHEGVVGGKRENNCACVCVCGVCVCVCVCVCV